MTGTGTGTELGKNPAVANPIRWPKKITGTGCEKNKKIVRGGGKEISNVLQKL